MEDEKVKGSAGFGSVENGRATEQAKIKIFGDDATRNRRKRFHLNNFLFKYNRFLFIS